MELELPDSGLARPLDRLLQASVADASAPVRRSDPQTKVCHVLAGRMRVTAE